MHWVEDSLIGFKCQYWEDDYDAVMGLEKLIVGDEPSPDSNDGSIDVGQWAFIAASEGRERSANLTPLELI